MSPSSQNSEMSYFRSISHFISPVVCVALVIEYAYKSDAKLPGTSTIYYGLEMTSSTNSRRGGLVQKIYYNYGVPGGTLKFPKYICKK